ncbi:MAG: hypothetical protein KatS3mg087_1806 [Patescibacteria group bacterium]|nr:MAG: hypothetical protein KatS3mg087_1806 [Patescibacteria group bacterium]
MSRVRDFESPDLSYISENITNLIDQFNARVSDFRSSISRTSRTISDFVREINDMLPSFARFMDTADGASQLLRNIGLSFIYIGTAMASSRIIQILQALPGIIFGVSSPIAIVSNLIAGFATVWTGNLFNIREKTADFVSYVNSQMERLLDRFEIDEIFSDPEKVRQKAIELRDAILAALTDPVSTGRAISGFLNEVRERVTKAIIQAIEGETTNGNVFAGVLRSLIAGTIVFIRDLPRWARQLSDSIVDLSRFIVPSFGQMFQSVVDKVIPAFSFVFGRISGTITRVYPAHAERHIPEYIAGNNSCNH